MTFMDEAIQRSMPLWQEAADEEFLVKMGSGELDKKLFYDYIIQDSIYLRDYLKAFAMAIVKADSIKQMQVFYTLLSFVNDGENATRLKYLADCGYTDAMVDKTDKKTACANYTRFLTETAANEQIPEILMAVMPCMLGYGYVFKQLLNRSPQVMNTYYAPLVGDYASPYYEQMCSEWTDYCNTVCGGITGARRSKLIDIFYKASAHELYFWQMAGGKYKGENK